MNPTTGIADCCARAVSDHATTVLLKSLMNSRRLMGFTPLAENHLRASLIRTWSDGHAPHRSMSGGVMSALGQKRTLGTATKIDLFDHLVGGVQQAQRHVEAKRVCCL